MEVKPMTNEASKIAVALYKQYLENKNSNADNAKQITETMQDEICSDLKINSNDFWEDVIELKENEYLTTDCIGNVFVQKNLIIKMEQRFKTGLLEVIDGIKTIADFSSLFI